MILLAKKWKNGIIVSSMRYFNTLQDLYLYIQSHPDKSWSLWYAYYVFSDGSEAKALTPTEYKTVGLR